MGRRRRKAMVLWGALAVALAAGAAAVAAAPRLRPAEAASAAGPSVAPAAQFQRADAGAIRQEAGNVLADPRFAPRNSLRDWILEKLGELKFPSINWGASGLADFISWLIIGLCVAALLAVLVHLFRAIAGWFGGRKGRAGGLDARKPFAGLLPPDATYDQLELLRRQFASEGRYREAVVAMMAALLRRLDAQRLVRFHQSKTNGEYVREFPSACGGREEFRGFVRAFDSVIYGGEPCVGPVYRQMDTLYEQVRGHAGPKP